MRNQKKNIVSINDKIYLFFFFFKKDGFEINKIICQIQTENTSNSLTTMSQKNFDTNILDFIKRINQMKKKKDKECVKLLDLL